MTRDAIKEAILKMALKQFKRELSTPGSAVAAKFNTMLYGDPANGTPGLFDKFTEYDPKEGIMTEEQLQNEIGRYKRNLPQVAADVAGTTLSTLGQGVGKTIAGGSNLFGNALIAMSKSRAGNIANPIAPLLGAAGNVAAMGGKIAGGALNTVGKTIGAISNDIKSNREKEREAELLIREHPNGAFYDARRKLTTGVQKGYTV